MTQLVKHFFLFKHLEKMLLVNSANTESAKLVGEAVAKEIGEKNIKKLFLIEMEKNTLVLLQLADSIRENGIQI